METVSRAGMSQATCLAYMVKPKAIMLMPITSMLKRPSLIPSNFIGFRTEPLTMQSDKLVWSTLENIFFLLIVMIKKISFLSGKYLVRIIFYDDARKL